MLAPDRTSAFAASGTREEVDALVAALRGGKRPAEAASLPAEFVEGASDVLAGADGQIEVTLSDPRELSEHVLVLARAGTLRRSRGLTGPEDLALHPTTALPGVLLRLAGIAPVEPLPPEIALDPAPDVLADLFVGDGAARRAAWTRMREDAATLPDAALDELEQAPPRAVHLVRRRAGGDRSALVVMLRGRYLVAAPDGAAPLTGTAPHGAARALLRPLVSGSGEDPARAAAEDAARRGTPTGA